MGCSSLLRQAHPSLFLILSPTPQPWSHPPISSLSQTKSSQNLLLQLSVSTNSGHGIWPRTTPHDLIQLDCYFYRLVLRSISQECYIHCHAVFVCHADGAFLEFYGNVNTWASSLHFRPHTLWGPEESPEGLPAHCCPLSSLFAQQLFPSQVASA